MAERKDVFTVVERKEGKPFWVKVGSAFVNKDGSLSVFLDALPVNGKLQIRTPSERRDGGDRVSGGAPEREPGDEWGGR